MYRESETRQRQAAIPAQRGNVAVARTKDPVKAFHALIPLIVVVLVALAFVVL